MSCSNVQTNIKTTEKHTQETKTGKYPTIEETVNTLASDKFEGRATGSPGNEAAAEYIKNAFQSLNLTPLFEDSYYQTYYQAVKSDYKSNNSEKKLKQLKNVVGVIKGKNPKKAVIVSAHFDHIGYKNGNIVRGALDNASGVSALLEIANILKKKSTEYEFDTNIVFCAFNSEEIGYGGSGAFNTAIRFDIYSDFYNINIDCIGAKEGGKLALGNRGNASNVLYDSVKSTLEKNNVEFSNKQPRGGSDHLAFDYVGVPNIYITEENALDLIHRPTDTPEIIDYEKIRDISKSLSDFIISNDKTVFIKSK